MSEHWKGPEDRRLSHTPSPNTQRRATLVNSIVVSGLKRRGPGEEDITTARTEMAFSEDVTELYSVVSLEAGQRRYQMHAPERFAHMCVLCCEYVRQKSQRVSESAELPKQHRRTGSRRSHSPGAMHCCLAPSTRPSARKLGRSEISPGAPINEL